jgi:hypothetical protein
MDGHAKPLGVIHTGPIHALRSSKTDVLNPFWYEPDYVEDRALFVPPPGWGPLEHKRRQANRKIQRLGYRHDLEEILVRFAGALDQSNLDIACIQLWGLLEKITDTVGSNYDETIRRASWVFEDREIAKAQLESVRLRRNLFVHSARSSDDREQVAQMIKGLVEPHLVRLIRNDFRVRTIREYANCLKLSRNEEVIKRQRQRLGRVQ